MKIIRRAYIVWNNIDMIASLEHEESALDIDINIWAVSWSVTGVQYGGCIVHEHLPACINTKIPRDKTTLAFDKVELRYVPFSQSRKKMKRKEWDKILLGIVDKIAQSNIVQHTLF